MCARYWLWTEAKSPEEESWDADGGVAVSVAGLKKTLRREISDDGKKISHAAAICNNDHGECLQR